MSAKDFKQSVRTTPEGFHFIFNKIKEHHVFKNKSNHKQLPISHQLALTLERLGTNGNGASVGRFARSFGISEGSVVHCSRRVIKAINALEEKYIKWPDMDRCRKISQVMAQEGFEGCIGFIDGTTFPIYQNPGFDGEIYFDRKKNYSLNAQIVCDCDKVITCFMAGWPGSCADGSLYKEMAIYQHSHEFFESAYPLSHMLIPSFKAPTANKQINKELNYCISQARVCNEHTIGILKDAWEDLALEEQLLPQD
ncbi:hypothetical protein O181_049866 [Austropuccinia psidii MF-1]|uniref:DDE Tnp4 domain-containing protein n=1 Tax=Austropuccinia psidii MF-1 TaxID=1389203 RepID=A0A9Q3DT73_9BASI|nr:hypothetical protein [Austropuccinia psidii MF-1]